MTTETLVLVMMFLVLPVPGLDGFSEAVDNSLNLDTCCL